MWVAQDTLTGWVVEVVRVTDGGIATADHVYRTKSFMWPMEDVDVEFHQLYRVPVECLAYLN